MNELDAASLWKRVLEGLTGRISAQTIKTILEPLDPMDAVSDGSSGTLLLVAGNDFARDWAARSYGKLLEEQLQVLTGISWKIQWTVLPSTATPPAKTEAAPVKEKEPAPKRTNAAPAAALTSRIPAETAVNPATEPAPTPSAPPSPPPVKKGQGQKTLTASKPAPAGSPGKDAADPPRTVGAMSAGLRPTYTFDNFVVGPSNQLAHAAALAMAQPVGRRFNPLFLCGPSGLGKTHLLNAVGHSLLGQKPGSPVVYVSAEHFTNEFVNAVRAGAMDEFRARYRNECDALLLDDVQFFAGKEQTLDEFFHTFNALFQRDRPIVLTSDVMPQHLQGMPDRLVSRFSSGMVAEVYPPELETRVAILRKKAALEGIHLDDDAAFTLAQAVATNMRELEGTLMKLAFKASLSKRAGVDGAMVREALRIPSRTAVTTVEDIQRAVCEFYRIKQAQLVGKERHAEVALPRQVAMYLCRERLGTSFPQIGAKFGGKDHTTVIAAVNKIKKLVEEEAPLVRDIDAIVMKLGGDATGIR